MAPAARPGQPGGGSGEMLLKKLPAPPSDARRRARSACGTGVLRAKRRAAFRDVSPLHCRLAAHGPERGSRRVPRPRRARSERYPLLDDDSTLHRFARARHELRHRAGALQHLSLSKFRVGFI